MSIVAASTLVGKVGLAFVGYLLGVDAASRLVCMFFLLVLSCAGGGQCNGLQHYFLSFECRRNQDHSMVESAIASDHRS
eukprot:scaffold193799_cov37-Attheya_sp.AAC.1